jgi:nucleoid DNA-binding protein
MSKNNLQANIDYSDFFKKSDKNVFLRDLSSLLYAKTKGVLKPGEAKLISKLMIESIFELAKESSKIKIKGLGHFKSYKSGRVSFIPNKKIFNLLNNTGDNE